MTDLDDLLEGARKADKAERISWRDPIADHGDAAIHVLRDWLSDPELGAFSVRVLEKIALRPADRPAAIDALASVGPEATTPAVARDIASALEHLGSGRSHGVAGSKRAAPSDWAGYATASPLERRFHDDMLDVFRLAGEATRKQRSDGTFIRAGPYTR